MSKIRVEYIWTDGHLPTAKLRSKTKIIDGPIKDVSELPEWGFDGSSTEQAEGHFSDCLLRPVRLVLDPMRGGDNLLVMCEVFNSDGTANFGFVTETECISDDDCYDEAAATWAPPLCAGLQLYLSLSSVDLRPSAAFAASCIKS